MSETAGVQGGTGDGSGDRHSADSPAAGSSAATSSAAASTGGLAKVWEWLWLGQAVQGVHARGSTLTPRGQELLRRARLAAELGGRALEPPEPLPSGSAEALACELYRESIEWSLAAHQEQQRVVAARGEARAAPEAKAAPDAKATSEADADGSGSSLNQDPTAPGSVSKQELTALWEAAEPELLAKGNSDANARKQLRTDIAGRTYRDFAELDASEQSRLARSLRKFAEGLTGALDAAQNELDRLWLKRVLRLGLLIVVLGGGGLFLFKRVFASEASRDIAGEAMWSASSKWAPEPGCEPPAQECANSPNYFIATNDDDEPWLMFEFKEPMRISGLRIDNRLDCCYDRAIPMVVEVSDDAKSWKEVTRRTTDFTSWRENFDPVTTRYVRLRVLKKTFLNLSRVRLFP